MDFLKQQAQRGLELGGRGALALTASGGVQARVLGRQMTRAPLFAFDSFACGGRGADVQAEFLRTMRRERLSPVLFSAPDPHFTQLPNAGNGGNLAIPGDNEIRPSISRRPIGATRYPLDSPGVT